MTCPACGGADSEDSWDGGCVCDIPEVWIAAPELPPAHDIGGDG